MDTKLLKVGDEVVVRRALRLPRITKVVRVTPKTGRIVTECGTTFNSHGFGIGNHYGMNHPYLAELTPEAREEIERANLEHKIRTLDIKSMSIHQLRAIKHAATGKHRAINVLREIVQDLPSNPDRKQWLDRRLEEEAKDLVKDL